MIGYMDENQLWEYYTTPGLNTRRVISVVPALFSISHQQQRRKQIIGNASFGVILIAKNLENGHQKVITIAPWRGDYSSSRLAA
jgi:hypothetical protein